MKFATFIAVVAISVCVVVSIEASPESRRKRAVAREMCPEGMSEVQCEKYAQKKLDESGNCERFLLSGNEIEWQSCGVIMCPEGAQLVEDKSKPYPDCCPRCG